MISTMMACILQNSKSVVAQCIYSMRRQYGIMHTPEHKLSVWIMGALYHECTIVVVHIPE